MASTVEPQSLSTSKVDDRGRKPGSDVGSFPNGHTHPPSPPATDTESEPENEEPIIQAAAKDGAGTMSAAATSVPRSIPTPQESSGAPASISELGHQARILDPEDQEGGDNRIFYSPESSPPGPAPIKVLSPPYWPNKASSSNAEAASSPRWNGRARGNHLSTVSQSSVDSFPTGGITLRDNETSSLDDRGSACWARSVEITDYVIINGSISNIGAFVVYTVKVTTDNGSPINIRKRYSEFDEFRWRLVRTFPSYEAAVPELPPKSVIAKFRPKFLEKRRAGLQYFLNCIMLHPEFSGSPIMKEFLFS